MSPAPDRSQFVPGSGFSSPLQYAFAIAPNDNSDVPSLTRAIFVGGAGNISVIMENDTEAVTLVGVVAGSLLPMRVTRVRSTGTTATNLVGLY